MLEKIKSIFMGKEAPQQRVRAEIPILDTDPDRGLTGAQAAHRREGGWSAGEPVPPGKSEREIVLDHCFTFFNLIFVVMGLLLLIAGSSILNMGFLLVAVINTVIGIVQQIRAKRAVDKLSLLNERPVRVLRDGRLTALPPEELVRDDIVEYAPGDTVPADGLLRTGEFQVDESLITGEADPVTKRAGDNIVSGSLILSGHGRVRLTAVGSDAFAAKLAAEAKANPAATKSEMMRSLDKLIRVIGFLLLPVGIALFCQELFALKMTFRESTEGTVAALVGMIPEGLYLLTSIAMAASSLKLSRSDVLVQDLNCIESLARVDILCVDKTGTITEPTMEVQDLVPLGGAGHEELEQILAALFTGFTPDNDTGRAMAELYGRESNWKCTRRIPFSPQYKWSGGEFAGHGAYVVGAPEFLLGDRFSEVARDVETWMADGCRVLLVAGYDGAPIPGALEPEKLSPLALVLLSSRLRRDARETFAYFAAQGVSIRVISGDSGRAASIVAGRAGIAGADRYIDATALKTELDYARAVRKTVVFGRVTPEQKKYLIAAMQAQGHTVAMTGDGVNDLLAMKQADCSVAMASGVSSASQVASLVLLKSDFSSMPRIVGEGRRVINNIQRASALFLVKNIFSLLLTLICLITGWAYPLIPIHLTVVAALTIGAPSFFLALEPNYTRIKGRFLPTVLRRAFPGGLTNVVLVCIAMAFRTVLDLDSQQIGTIAAVCLAAVGMLVLTGVCYPFDKFRAWLCAVMGVALVGCFTLLGGILGFSTGTAQSNLLLVAMLIMAPTVYFAMLWLFDQGDKLWDRWQLYLRNRRNRPRRKK